MLPPVIRPERRFVLLAWTGAVTAGGALVLVDRLGGQSLASLVSPLARGITLLTAMVVMARSTRHSTGSLRRARWLFAAALAASGAGAVISLGYVVVKGSVPVPSVADPVTLLWVPFAIAGFWFVPARDGRAGGTRRVLADGAVAASAAFFITWVLVLKPLQHHTGWSGLQRTVELCFPICDAFVGGMTIGLLGRARADVRRLVRFVALGLILIAVSDSGGALLLAHHGPNAFAWTDVVTEVGMVFVLAGALAPAADPITLPAGKAADYLPFVVVIAATVTGLWHGAAGHGLQMSDGIIGGAMLLTVLAREALYTAELRALLRQRHHDAVHDALTGLANRKMFLESIRERLSVSAPGTLAVLLIDLDGFKEINDGFGHETGDEVLRGFADQIVRTAANQMVARLGGDEFAVAVVGPDAEAVAVSIGSTLVQGCCVPTRATVSMSVKCSIGVGVSQADDGPSDLLRRADLAMYDAKRSSAGRLSVYQAHMAVAANHRHLLAAELPHAIHGGQLHIAYQPIYRIADGELVGAEALLRWTHPIIGPVSPTEFIPLAEDTGHINAIGDWVLRTAIGQLARWDRAGLRVPRLFINVSAHQLTPGLDVTVLDVLRREGVPPARLTLEITESELVGLMADSPLHLLRDTGVHVALDDFGAGYSNLTQLSRLPVDTLKIDGELVRHADGATGAAIMASLMTLAKALHLTTVAEGVETEAHLAHARETGIDFVQGFLYTAPVPAAEFRRRLEALARRPVGGPITVGAATPSR